MPSRRTRRSVLAAASLVTVAGCLSSVSNDDDRSPGGTTEGDGFSERRFGTDATAPMVRYDAANTGASASATGPSTAPTERWATELTLGSPARPTALGETVFTNSVNGVCGFTVDGERRWAYDTTGSELNPAPVAVVRDRVYATRTTAVFALDAKTGDERWVFTPSPETNRLTAPAVAGDTVYVVGQHPERSPTVWALAPPDGSVRWRVELGGETAGPPVVTDGRVYCATTKGGLYAVDVTGKAVSWERSLTPAVGPPAATADGVFVTTMDGAVCYDRDGTLRWRVPETTPLTIFPHDGPVLDDTTLYTAGPEGESIVALTVDDGDERWRAPLSGDVRSPVLTPESVYVQNTTDEIKALARTDGSVEWTANLSLRSVTGITVADGGLLVGADDRLLRYG
jgi:outer membrane protein assembly factor BamB